MADTGLAVSVFLALRLKRPLFLEGEAGVGKTALAAAMAAALDTDLIRLQCYEGLDVSHALYEWDYARQLLELRILDATHALDRDGARRELYSEAFLIKRPLLQAIDPSRTRPAVLLIDEIDRADEEFEGFLLELLAEFQITIPELGTVRAAEPPLVILTSNRTREVHDALKRRCLYQWIDYPSFEKELAIVRAARAGGVGALAEQVTAMVQELRTAELYKVPGVSETIDWVAALVALDRETLDADAVDETLGVVLKAKEDLEALRGRARVGTARSRDAHGQRRSEPDARLLDNLLIFGRLLRRAGIDVHAGRMLDVVEALSHVTSARETRSITRAARCSSTARIRSRVFDRRVRCLLARITPRRSGIVAATNTSTAARQSSTIARRGRRPEKPTTRRRDGCRPTREAQCGRGATAAALARQGFRRAHRRRNSPRRAGALARLAWNPGERRTRRWVRGRGARIDLRRAIAESLRTGGDVVRAAAAQAADPATPARPPLRRQRLDGALLAHAPALRARVDAPPPAGRGVPVLHATHASHQGASHQRDRTTRSPRSHER